MEPERGGWSQRMGWPASMQHGDSFWFDNVTRRLKGELRSTLRGGKKNLSIRQIERLGELDWGEGDCASNALRR